jgi:uncharacterized protein YvpB
VFILIIKTTKVYRFEIKPSYVDMSQVLHVCILDYYYYYYYYYNDDYDGLPGARLSIPTRLKSCTN